MHRRLVAAIACRNQGSRLYGKPLQNLDEINQIRILDNIIDCLRTISCIDEIILGISEGEDNEVYKRIAEEKGINYIVGDEQDVLSRLIRCGEVARASDIFRITSESPFCYFEVVADLWTKFCDEGLDAVFLDEIVDGCGFEIITLNALQISHKNGSDKHRSELCSLYLREHSNEFKILKALPPKELIRKDLRLTVDNPEDLVVCRALYKKFTMDAPNFSVAKLVRFLDERPDLKKMILPFTEVGYSTMNL